MTALSSGTKKILEADIGACTRAPLAAAVALAGAWVSSASPPEAGARPAAVTVASNLMVEQEVLVGTRISGLVESFQADRGDVVTKGQALATLDQREFRLDLRAAEETLAVSASDLKRYEELRRLNLASEAELEQKRSRWVLAGVELDRAKLVIDRSVIRAPFDGVVVDRFARIGEKFLVEENKPLFKVMALEPLLARAYVPASSSVRIRPGDEVGVSVPGSPDGSSTGRVTFVSPVVDPASGTVQVIVKVRRDPKRILRPGVAVQLAFGPAPPP